MPKQTGIYKKKMKHGFKYYGAKWWKGKTYVTSLYPTSQEAAEAREQLIKELKKGFRIDKRKITVKEFLKLYFRKYLIPKYNNGDIEKSSLKTMESFIRNGIIPRIGDERLQKLNTEMMQDLQNDLRRHYSANIVNKIMGLFKRALKIAKRWNYIAFNPAEDIEIIKVKSSETLVLTDEEFLILFQNASLREKAAITLGRFGGLRISETFGLKFDDFHFNQKLIHIQRQFYNGEIKPPKGGKERFVPILPDLEPIIKAWKLKCGSREWLFPGRHGKPLRPGGWNEKYLKPLLKQLNLPDITYHSFRHSFDTMLYDMGVKARDVMQMMGHSDIRTSMLYDKESPEHLVEITRSIKVFNDGFLRNSLRISGFKETI